MSKKAVGATWGHDQVPTVQYSQQCSVQYSIVFAFVDKAVCKLPGVKIVLSMLQYSAGSQGILCMLSQGIYNLFLLAMLLEAFSVYAPVLDVKVFCVGYR